MIKKIDTMSSNRDTVNLIYKINELIDTVNTIKFHSVHDEFENAWQRMKRECGQTFHTVIKKWTKLVQETAEKEECSISKAACLLMLLNAQHIEKKEDFQFALKGIMAAAYQLSLDNNELMRI